MPEKRLRFSIAIIGTMMLAVAAMISPARSPGLAQDQTKPIYRATGSEATITGTISFAGKPPQPKRIDAGADPVCEKASPELFTEDVIVRAGKLANVFVYIRSGDMLEWYSFEAASPEVSIAHRGCQLIPHVLGMQTQQVLKIANEDSTTHNTNLDAKSNPFSNQSQPPTAAPLEIKFKTPEVAIPVKDNQHPWERAYVAVLPHPFFAVSALNGSYQISGLPPGKYAVVAWHEGFGEQTAEISVGVGEHKKLDFTFSARDDRQNQ